MAAFLRSQTLIRRITSSSLSSRFLISRTYSGYPYFSTPSDGDAVPATAAEAMAVRIIEDAVHRVIVSRSEPDWLPFVPGGSYWVPPKRRNFGVAELLRTVSETNAHLAGVDPEVLGALVASRGWPSSSYYLGGSDLADSDSGEEQERVSDDLSTSTSMEDIDD